MEPLGLLQEARSVQSVDWSGPDMVGDVTYRPAEEQPDIVKSAIAMGAKSFGVHPPAIVSEDAHQMCVDAGMVFVQGVDIRDVVAALSLDTP